MPSSPASTLAQFDTALSVLASLPTDVLVLRDWDEATLLLASDLHARAGRLLGAAGAAIAGELAYRSRPECWVAGVSPAGPGFARSRTC